MADEMLEEKEKVGLRLDEESEAQPDAVSQVPSIVPESPDFDGRFDQIELLGEGGMGLVYKVRDPVLDKLFAVKLLRSSLTRDTQALKRFEKEAASAVGFDHPCLVAVYETGLLKDGTPFILMDYVDGSNLADVLRKDGPFSHDRALQIFEQILDALNYVHEVGLLHRDVKPRNIIVRTNAEGVSEVKLVDFGIAKVADSGDATTGGVTQTGDFLGSPLYMSPEQCQGRALTPQSDIYSAGCVLYEMLVGNSPFASPNPVKTVIGHLSEPVPPIASASADSQISGVNSMMLKCLEKSLDRRYQSVPQVQNDLSALMENRNPFEPEKVSKKLVAIPIACIALLTTLDVWLLSVRPQFPDKSVPMLLVSLALFVTLICVAKDRDRARRTGIFLALGVGSVFSVLCSLYRDLPSLPIESALALPSQILLCALGGLSIISSFKFAYHPESFFSKPSHALREVVETTMIKSRRILFRFAILSTVLFAILLNKMPESEVLSLLGGGALYSIGLAALLGGSLAIARRLKQGETTLAGDRWLVLINTSVAASLLFSAASKLIAYQGSQFAISSIDVAQWCAVLNALMIAALVSAVAFVSIYRNRANGLVPFGKSDGW